MEYRTGTIATLLVSLGFTGAVAVALGGCGDTVSAESWELQDLGVELETLPEGEWQPADNQPFARFDSPFSRFDGNEAWLGSDGTHVFYGREVPDSRWAVVAGSGEGDWSERREMNRAIDEHNLRPTGIYSVGDTLYIAGNYDTTLVREGGEEGSWEVADVHIKHAVATDGKLYASLHDPQELSGLAVKTPGGDWRRISNNDHPGDFRIAGDVIHFGGSYSTDGGETWRENDFETAPRYEGGSKVLPRVDGKYWGIGVGETKFRVITSTEGIEWESHNPEALGELVDLAAHDGTVVCLSTEGRREKSDATRQLFRRGNDGTWQAVDLPDGVSPHRVESTPAGLLVFARAGGLWQYAPSSDRLTPMNLPAGSPRFGAGDDLLVAHGGAGGDIAVRQRGEEDARWRYIRRRGGNQLTVHFLEAAGDLYIHDTNKPPTPSRLHAIEPAPRLQSMLESDNMDAVYGLVHDGERQWIGDFDAGIAKLEDFPVVDTNNSDPAPDEDYTTRTADMTASDAGIWVAKSRDDTVSVLHAAPDETLEYAEEGLPDRFDASKPGRNLTNEVQLAVVDGVPLLGVAERDPAKADQRAVEYRVYGWNSSEQRWVSVTSVLEELHVNADPSLETTNGALVLSTRSGLFQFDPEADEWSRLGSLDRLEYQSSLEADDGDVWVTRKGRGIWRYEYR